MKRGIRKEGKTGLYGDRKKEKMIKGKGKGGKRKRVK